MANIRFTRLLVFFFCGFPLNLFFYPVVEGVVAASIGAIITEILISIKERLD